MNLALEGLTTNEILEKDINLTALRHNRFVNNLTDLAVLDMSEVRVTTYKKIKELVAREMVFHNINGEFKNKVVYCNNDLPESSPIAHYFMENFIELELKGLIIAGYRRDNEPNYVMKYTRRDFDKVSYSINKTQKLDMNSHFDSLDRIELLNDVDIVITTPPQDKFHSFIELMLDYDKRFILLGDKENIMRYSQPVYNELDFDIILLMKENKLWLGHTSANTLLPIDDISGFYVESVWFTNIMSIPLKEPIPKDNLVVYKPNTFHSYDNCDAIHVSHTYGIPVGYDGLMCVKYSFLEEYNPEQFEIVGSVSDYIDNSKYTDAILNPELFEEIPKQPIIEFNKAPVTSDYFTRKSTETYYTPVRSKGVLIRWRN